MASLYKLPCIFVVENNKWAIGMYHERATGPSAGDDEPYIYKKGPAFGMPGVLVDGMDVRKVKPRFPPPSSLQAPDAHFSVPLLNTVLCASSLLQRLVAIQTLPEALLLRT